MSHAPSSPVRRVIVAGGGTGGHLYPGIAVARAMLRRDPGLRVSFVGTARGLEHRVVPAEGFELDLIRSAGLKGKSAGAVARGFGVLPLSAVDAWRVLMRRRPALVIGVGGYSSGPVVALAALRGTPTLLLEQNAMPGLANRLLARMVDGAAVTYEASLRWFHGHGVVTGNPVREAFLSVPARQPDGQRRTLLVFGGSQGARAINQAMVAAAPQLRELPGELAIVHQTGQADEASVRDGYRQAGLPADVHAFLDDMPARMAAADLVVCRAGATTLAEITAAGRAAVLIPLPSATDDHQRRNAAALGEAGAAEVLDQDGLTPQRLAAVIAALLADDSRRAAMAAAARTLARPDAAERIADRAFALMAGEAA